MMQLPDQPIPDHSRGQWLYDLSREIEGCERCQRIAKPGSKIAAGYGGLDPGVMFVGESLDYGEGEAGLTFAGNGPGTMLRDMIHEGMGLIHCDLYVTHLLKVLLPADRDPLPDEIRHCLPHLEQQISIIRPKSLCLMGRVVSQALLNTHLGPDRLRGKWHRYRDIPAIVTHTPAYLFHRPDKMEEAWDDLQLLMDSMERGEVSRFQIEIALPAPEGPIQEVQTRNPASTPPATKPDVTTTEWYRTYLTGAKWKALRQKVLRRARGLCEGCLKDYPTQVHHLTYRDVGNEFAFQLVALCPACHRRYHSKKDQ